MVKRDQEKTVLVLQGGGALGAYQAGAYEALAEAGFEPDWIAGISIGAINGALIAGNRPEHRVANLRAFWEKISSGLQGSIPFLEEMVRPFFNDASANLAATFGIPGFFCPAHSARAIPTEGDAGGDQLLRYGPAGAHAR